MDNDDNSKYLKTFFLFNVLAYYIFAFVSARIDFRLWTEEYRTYYVMYGVMVGGLFAFYQYVDDNWKL